MKLVQHPKIVLHYWSLRIQAFLIVLLVSWTALPTESQEQILDLIGLQPGFVPLIGLILAAVSQFVRQEKVDQLEKQAANDG